METLHDDHVVVELLDLIILNEFLRKTLLLEMSKWISRFEKTSIFDFKRPVAYIDFFDFVKNDEKQSSDIVLTLNQFLFNLELFAIKFYRLGEISKKHLKNTNLKKLRQAFTHRTSGDILLGKERLVLYGGIFFDLDTFIVSNLGVGGHTSEKILYEYGKYVNLILDHYSEKVNKRIENVKLLRELNRNLLESLY